MHFHIPNYDIVICYGPGWTCCLPFMLTRSCDLLWYVNAFQKMASLALRQGFSLKSKSCFTIMANMSQKPNAVGAKKVTQPFFFAHLKKFSSSAAQSDRYKDELLQKQMANDNPFDTYVTKPEPGRGLFEGSPVLVPSTRYLIHISLTEKVTWIFRDSRMVGCCCEDDYQDVVWFELKKGPPQVSTTIQ